MHCSKGKGREGNERISLSWVWLVWGSPWHWVSWRRWEPCGPVLFMEHVYFWQLYYLWISIVGQTGTELFWLVGCNDCEQRVGYLLQSGTPSGNQSTPLCTPLLMDRPVTVGPLSGYPSRLANSWIATPLFVEWVSPGTLPSLLPACNEDARFWPLVISLE